MRANTVHMAFTVSHVDDRLKTPISVVHGSLFYAESNLTRTMLARWAERLWSVCITNAVHWEAESLLHRMIFQMARQLDRCMDDVTANALEKVANDDHSGGSYYGLAARNSLIYMLICFEMFTPLVRNTTVPPMPHSFLSQQWNGRAVAYDLYLGVKKDGGQAWDSLCQFIDEMDDRISNGDDILSPFRALISEAQKLPPVLRGIKTNIHDTRFDAQRQRFFSKPTHNGTAPEKSHYTPRQLHSWSNIAENTVFSEVDISKSKGLWVYRPNPLQVRHLTRSNVTLPFKSRSNHHPEDSSSHDAFVVWREKVAAEINRVLTENAKDRHWLTKAHGGSMNDKTGSWIGQLSVDDV